MVWKSAVWSTALMLAGFACAIMALTTWTSEPDLAKAQAALACIMILPGVYGVTLVLGATLRWRDWRFEDLPLGEEEYNALQALHRRTKAHTE